MASVTNLIQPLQQPMMNTSCLRNDQERIQTVQQRLESTFKDLERIKEVKEKNEGIILNYQNQINQQLANPNNPQQYQKAQEVVSSLSRQIEKLKENVRATYEHSAQLIKKISTDICACTQMCETLMANGPKDELEKWRQLQKVAQYGGPDAVCQLSKLAKRCQFLTETICTTLKYLQQTVAIMTKFNFPQNGDQIQNKLLAMLYQMLNTSFLVTYQPPMIVKNQIKVRVGLLGATEKIGIDMQRTFVQCYVISEEVAAEIKRCPEKIKNPIVTIGEIDSKKMSEKIMETLQKENVMGFEMSSMKLKVDSRKSNTKDGEGFKAIKQKYYLLFKLNLSVSGIHFPLFTLSLPFMVSVHGSQDKDLWAKAFWDMAFSNGSNEIPMKGRTEVPWSELAAALKNVFSCILYTNTERKNADATTSSADRKLTDSDLNYIKCRLFSAQIPFEENPMITWDQFYTKDLDHMSTPEFKLDFSFWDWFFKIADMLQEKSGHETKVKPLWNNNLIEGFVSKSEAENKLSSCRDPTFLIRFCDNNLCSVSVVVLTEEHQVKHLIPWANKDTINEANTLPQLLEKCSHLDNVFYIYPKQTKQRIYDLPPNQPKPVKTPHACLIGYEGTQIVTHMEVEPRSKCSSVQNSPYPTSPYAFSPSSVDVESQMKSMCTPSPFETSDYIPNGLLQTNLNSTGPRWSNNFFMSDVPTKSDENDFFDVFQSDESFNLLDYTGVLRDGMDIAE